MSKIEEDFLGFACYASLEVLLTGQKPDDQSHIPDASLSASNRYSRMIKGKTIDAGGVGSA